MKLSYSRMTPKKRKARLQELLRRIDDGHDVAARDLKLALTEAQYQSFMELWSEQRSIRSMERTHEIRKYEKLLAAALFLHNKAEGHKANRKLNALGESYKTSLYNQTEAACEDALECLSDMLSHDPGQQIWFDRTVDFENTDSCSPRELPRLVTSRSIDKLGGIKGKLTKREIKRAVLEDALQKAGGKQVGKDLVGLGRESNEDQKARMDKMLQRTRHPLGI